jgi:hypothetical protein
MGKVFVSCHLREQEKQQDLKIKNEKGCGSG